MSSKRKASATAARKVDVDEAAPISTAHVGVEAPSPSSSTVRRVAVPPLSPSPTSHSAALFELIDNALANERSDKRLVLLLQLAVAELRAIDDSVDPTDPLHGAITGALRSLGARHKERDLGYVFGLAVAHYADWMGLALSLRKKLETIDAK